MVAVWETGFRVNRPPLIVIGKWQSVFNQATISWTDCGGRSKNGQVSRHSQTG